MGTRTTIQIDESLLERVRRFVPSRGLNRFINRAPEEKVRALERQETQELVNCIV